MPKGKRGGSGARIDLKLTEDVRHVLHRRTVTDEKPIGDFTVRASLSQQFEHFALSRRQSIRRGGRFDFSGDFRLF
jgi:hypothetical protein